MWVGYYIVLVLGACALTAAWLFKPEDRTVLTTTGAFLAWGIVALTGNDVELFDNNVEEVVEGNSTSVAVAQTGEFVAAPIPEEIRLFAGLWALLSALALILYVAGVYPPTSDEEISGMKP